MMHYPWICHIKGKSPFGLTVSFPEEHVTIWNWAICLWFSELDTKSGCLRIDGYYHRNQSKQLSWPRMEGAFQISFPFIYFCEGSLFFSLNQLFSLARSDGLTGLKLKPEKESGFSFSLTKCSRTVEFCIISSGAKKTKNKKQPNKQKEIVQAPHVLFCLFWYLVTMSCKLVVLVMGGETDEK